MTPHNSRPEYMRTVLVVPLTEAQERVSAQIQEGKGLLGLDIQLQDDFDEADNKFQIWRAVTQELLKQISTTSELADEFISAAAGTYVGAWEDVIPYMRS